MAIMRWEGFRDLLSLQDRMNRLFDESARVQGRGEERATGTWAPAVDIYEQGSDLVLKAELPGVDSKDVDIHIEDNVLTLKGERKVDSEVERDHFHRVERAYGAFTRAFTLPTTVDTAKVKADFRDGVLRIVLPKREESKPKQVQIEVGA